MRLMRVGFIGTGNMAGALARAIASAKPSVTVVGSDSNVEALNRLSQELPRFEAAPDNASVFSQSDVTFLSIKPQVMNDVLSELSGATGLLVSIAAGVRIGRVEQSVPGARVVRVMPNTPCLVGEMAAGYALGRSATEQDASVVHDLLSCAGVAVRLPEEQLDAVTGLSGSGPAFVARLIGAFVSAGVSAGLSKEAARQLTLKTFSGTARLLADRDLTVEDLVNMVSSKGGTTVAGRAVLEASDYAEIIAGTIQAAVERSRELGR